MGLHPKYIKLLCNGVLLLALFLALAVFLLNLLKSQTPPLRCDSTGIVEPSISHVYKGDTISTSKLLICTMLVPLIQIIVVEWFCNKDNPYTINVNESSRWKRTAFRAFRWFKDYICVLALVILMADIAKTTLTYPRPHWLDSCKPVYSKDACKMGWLYDYDCSNSTLTSWKLADAKKSFPSSHAALSFYAAVFMGIYQQRRINKKVVGMMSLLWLHICWFGFAVFCSVSRVSDRRHHPFDVMAGAVAGTTGALISAFVFCNGFRKSRMNHLGAYQNKVVSGANGSATMVDIYPTTNNSNNGPLPAGLNGGSRLPNHDSSKRPSLRRLLSTQSSVSQMTDIVEDRELDSL